jgi:hypothetical protein
VSFAQDHPVLCARKDEGCTASYPSSKHYAMRAVAEGWFISRAEEASYCPAHLPEWVPAWRAKQAARRFEVAGQHHAAPAVLACGGCSLYEVTDTEPAGDTVTELRARAYEHGRETGHTVSVSTSRVLVVEPVRDAVDA